MMVMPVIWQDFLLFWQRRERGTDFAEEGAVVGRKAGGPRTTEVGGGWGRASDRRLDVEWEKPEAAGNLWLSVRPQGIEKSFDKDCLTSKKF